MHFARIVFIAFLFALSGKSFAASMVFDTMEQCLTAIKAGQVEGYEPKTDAPFKPQPDWEKKVVPAGGACLGGAHVIEDNLPKKGRVVFVKEGFVYWKHKSGAFRMDKCSNHFSAINFPGDPPAQPAPPAPAASTPVGTCEGTGCGDITRTQTVTQIIRQEVICPGADGVPVRVNGLRCDLPQVDVRVSMAVSAGASCGQACVGGTKEKVTVTREETRSDGRCFVQTNVGYRFELRANASSGRLMVALVDQKDKKVEGTQAQYVGNVQASKNAKGFDCDGMQQQLYTVWEEIRSSYGLPSACRLVVTTKASAADKSW